MSKRKRRPKRLPIRYMRGPPSGEPARGCKRVVAKVSGPFAEGKFLLEIPAGTSKRQVAAAAADAWAARAKRLAVQPRDTRYMYISR